MNIEARIEKIKVGVYESFIYLGQSSVPGIKMLSISNPEERPLFVGDFISFPITVCFVNNLVQEPKNRPQYIRQVAGKNGTEVCGILESLTDGGDFICKVSNIGTFLVELENVMRPAVGSTVSFTGELRAEI